MTGGSDDEEDLGEDEDDDDAGAGRSLDAAARAQRLAERLQNDVALVGGLDGVRARAATLLGFGVVAAACDRAGRVFFCGAAAALAARLATAAARELCAAARGTHSLRRPRWWHGPFCSSGRDSPAQGRGYAAADPGLC